MTVNAARRTRRRAAPPAPEPIIAPIVAPAETLAIGEIGQTVFDCPKCSRPLAVGARRCPGCGTRLVLGTPLSKASVFVTGGLAVGLLLGGGGAVIAMPRVTPTPAPGSVAVLPSAAPVSGGTNGAGSTAAPLPSAVPGTGGGSTTTSGMPVAAQAALVQAATMNHRLAAGAANLAAVLAAPTFDASAVAETLREMSADSLYAEQVADRVSSWQGSAEVGGDLATMYRGIHEIAAEALVASVQNQGAYRQAARQMLTLFAGARAIDGRIQALAAANGVTLPEPSTAP